MGEFTGRALEFLKTFEHLITCGFDTLQKMVQNFVVQKERPDIGNLKQCANMCQLNSLFEEFLPLVNRTGPLSRALGPLIPDLKHLSPTKTEGLMGE